VRQILITPTIYDEHVESRDESMRGANAALGKCRDFVLEFGKARNIPVVDFWHPMNEINRTRQQADASFTLVGKNQFPRQTRPRPCLERLDDAMSQEHLVA
jgi:hypothetical protein